MNPVNPAKFGVAFAAGLFAALAGVLIYVKTGGIQMRDPVPATLLRQVKQPQNLSAGKVEQPKAITAPRVLSPAPQVEKLAFPPVAHSADPTPAPAPKKTVVAAARRHFTPHVTRVRYSPHRLSDPPSVIRVEVSQITPAAEVQTPQPVTPLPAVSEEQPVPTSAIYNPPPAVPAEPQPHVVTLQAGTNLVIRLGETLSTDHNYNGDTFRATLVRPVIMDGFIIADKGSKVLGKITGIEKGGGFAGASTLQLAVTEINTTDGQRVHVQTNLYDKKGTSSDPREEAAKIGGGAALGAIIGAVAGGGRGAAIGAGAGGALGVGAVMAAKGRPAVLPTETLLTFHLSTPATITEHLN